MYKSIIKRLLDFCLALLAIVLLSPVLLIIALLVRVKLGAPVLFAQKRPGKDEKLFTIFKFRTMTNDCCARGVLLDDSMRITRFGKMLRSTSLDELPQLINIVKGDMSFVGPRALLVEYLPYYSNKERGRHAVRPGVTGLAQVQGRNMLKWEDRFMFDLDYVDSVSFGLDLSILLRTVGVVLRRQNVLHRDSIPLDIGFDNLDNERRKEIEVDTSKPV